jgi:predicted HTH transcriptional regulator
MNKQGLINKLQDIEWKDFEVKTAKSEIPKKSWETVFALFNTGGYGFDKMINGWEEHYKNKPVITNGVDYYSIGFYFNQTTQKTNQKELTESQKRILLEIKNNPLIIRLELTSIIKDITEEGIKYNLKVLTKNGYIKRVGGRKIGSWQIIEEEI